MLNVKTLALVFPERSAPTLYKMIKVLKAKYSLNYKTAEIPINIIVKEYGIDYQVVLDLIKKEKDNSPKLP